MWNTYKNLSSFAISKVLKLFFSCPPFLSLILFSASPIFAASRITITDSRVIDNFSNLGIDVAQPHFAWILNSKLRGIKQIAYEVVVVANKNDFDNAGNIVWKSGKVSSGQQYGIVYHGKTLFSATKYWWKVRVWSNNKLASGWSKPVSFVTGFMRPKDWSPDATWIRHPKATSKEENPLPIFRKQFVINKKVRDAWLYICGLGQFNAYLNGYKIGNHVLDPAWTDYDKTVRYVTFDLTSELRSGKNALGVMLGNGLYAYKGMRDFGPLILLAQLHVNFEDGSSTNIVSDTSWKVHLSPFTSAVWDGSEDYDANLAVDGWNTADINDTKWDNAVSAKSPLGKLLAQDSPPVTVVRAFKPVKITSPAPNVILYDFGQNMNGQFTVDLKGKQGSVVKIMPAEDTTKEGRALKGRTSGCNYTMSGKGIEKFQLSFSSIGFRYLELQGVETDKKKNKLPCAVNVNAQFVSAASDITGSFKSSDRRYNDIFTMTLNTLRSNLISIHTDGPNYERLGWQEVTYTLLPGSSYYFNLHNLYSKIVRDVNDGQRSYGLSPDIAPNYWSTANSPAKNAFDDAPAWGASMITLPWQLYNIYGDSALLRRSLPNMRRYLSYLKSKETKKGIIEYGLGDWMAPAGNAIGNVEGAVYVQDVKIVYDATLLLHTPDTTYYKNEYERVRTAYNNAFFDQSQKTYVPMTQANLAMPLSFDIVPQEHRKAVIGRLINEIHDPVKTVATNSYGKPGEFGSVLSDHATTGDIATTFLWRALGQAGQADLVQKMIFQKELPSYLSMVNHGFTTMPENWNFKNTRSRNHDMYAGIFEWYFKTLGGISAIKPGFEEIRLKPSFPNGLDSVSVSTKTVRGVIKSFWKISNGHTNWDFTIPVNATAKVYIPISVNRNIKESGSLIWHGGPVESNSSGIKCDGIETDPDSDEKFTVWTVGSGEYRMEW